VAAHAIITFHPNDRVTYSTFNCITVELGTNATEWQKLASTFNKFCRICKPEISQTASTASMNHESASDDPLPIKSTLNNSRAFHLPHALKL